ncbi:MAG: hypothetical protein GQ570_11740 [Helicobacteraceae bacterium]|nr:hypothetical protein [Helicobacteraceae bacterium]
MILINQDIDSFLTSNAENIITEYSSLTTYLTAEEAREESRIYKSISDSNLDNYPPDNIDKFWMDWEASNEYAMLDLFEDTNTTFTANGIVTFSRDTKEVIAIGKFNANQITIEYLSDVDAVLDTETYDFPYLGARIDAYSYIYADFETSTSEALYKPLQRLGTKIRVTFLRSGLDNYCGFLVAGKSDDMGKTLDNVNFTNRIIGFNSRRVANFNTIVAKTSLIPTIDKGELYKDIPLLFVIDPSENSSHANMVTIAKITKCDGVGSNNGLNTISWELTQN